MYNQYGVCVAFGDWRRYRTRGAVRICDRASCYVSGRQVVVECRGCDLRRNVSRGHVCRD